MTRSIAAPAPAPSEMPVDVLEIRIFLGETFLFSLAALGVIYKRPFLLLPLIGVHVVTLVTGVNDIFS